MEDRHTWRNLVYVKPWENYVADGVLRFTLREMRRIFSAPKTWGGIIGVAIILGVSGPFETSTALRLAPRLAYWFAVVLITYGAGSFIHLALGERLKNSGLPYWGGIGISGISSGVAVAAILLGLNWAAFGIAPFQAGYTLLMTANCIIVTVVVSIILGQFSAKNTASPMAKQGPRLLQRVPIEKRGELIFLSVQDHYVNVVTSKGSELVLMRLSDAMQETEGVVGMQVHRSHWVALAKVASAQRHNNKAVLTMRDGAKIPVSRTYLKLIKDAGLFTG